MEIQQHVLSSSYRLLLIFCNASTFILCADKQTDSDVAMFYPCEIKMMKLLILKRIKTTKTIKTKKIDYN